MEWVSFGVGLLSAGFVFALFSEDREEDNLETEEGMTVESDHTELEIRDVKGRTSKQYCQNCRKQKLHREIKTDVWQCSKCKRHIDFRAS